jgi:hypothetical protein
MKKVLFAATLAMIVTGCGDGTQQKLEASHSLANVKGLEDCVYNKVDPGGHYTSITVVRCPGSTTSTTYPVGKRTETVVVIDSVEYVKKK